MSPPGESRLSIHTMPRVGIDFSAARDVAPSALVAERGAPVPCGAPMKGSCTAPGRLRDVCGPHGHPLLTKLSAKRSVPAWVRLAAVCCVGACLVICSDEGSAHAHESLTGYGVTWRTEDADADFIVRSNRGLIVNTADGARLLCHAAVGAHTSEKLPMVSTEDGWLVGTTRGVVHLDKDGCPDEDAPRLDAGAVQDLQRDPESRSIYVVTAEASVGSGLFSSDDDGASFLPLAELEGDQFYNAVAFASDGEPFIYLSGAAFDQETGLIEHFVDTIVHSEAPVRHRVTLYPGETQIRALNTHYDGMLVQVVASSASGLPDRLLTSTTAGDAWSTLISAQAIHQVAPVATGQGLFVASGEGLYESDSTGEFGSIPLEWMPSCVQSRGEELVLCDALGVHTSTDPRRPETLMFFAEVTEPVSCDGSGAPVPECTDEWFDFEQELPTLPSSRPVVSSGDAGQEVHEARGVQDAASGCSFGLPRGAEPGSSSLWMAALTLLWGFDSVRRQNHHRKPTK